MHNDTMIYKKIDLSTLPTIMRGKKECIDWKHSVGKSMPFQYGDYIGEIKILNYNGDARKLVIEIEGVTPIGGCSVLIDSVKDVCLSNVFLKPINKTDLWMIQYMDDKNDANIYAKASNKRINTHCPICGYKKKYNNI